jgi:hypothetical protein
MSDEESPALRNGGSSEFASGDSRREIAPVAKFRRLLSRRFAAVSGSNS